MSILFAGGSTAGFDEIFGPLSLSVSASQYDSDYTSSGIRTIDGTNAQGYFGKSIPAQSSGWVYAFVFSQAATGNLDFPLFTVGNKEGDDLLRVNYLNGYAQLEAWNGASWDILAVSDTVINTSTLMPVSFYWSISDAGGELKFFMNQVENVSFTGDTLRTAATTADFIKFQQTANGGNAIHYSEFMITDAATNPSALRVSTKVPNGAGSNSGWTGLFSAVDDGGLYEDADAISSGAAEQVSTFAIPDLNAAITLDVLAVCVNARAKRGTTGPQNLALSLKSGATTYHSPDKALEETYEGRSHVWETDPATSAAWVRAAADAIEAGVKSRA